MTQQLMDSVRFEGERFQTFSTPLWDYFIQSGQQPPFKVVMTCLWRGHIASWEIIDQRLYLTGLTGTLRDGTEASLKTFFPSSDGHVFAEWYSDILRCPFGKLLKYAHGGGTYEFEHHFDIQEGVIQRHWKVDNRPKNEIKLAEGRMLIGGFIFQALK